MAAKAAAIPDPSWAQSHTPSIPFCPLPSPCLRNAYHWLVVEECQWVVLGALRPAPTEDMPTSAILVFHPQWVLGLFLWHLCNTQRQQYANITSTTDLTIGLSQAEFPKQVALLLGRFIAGTSFFRNTYCELLDESDSDSYSHSL